MKRVIILALIILAILSLTSCTSTSTVTIASSDPNSLSQTLSSMTNDQLIQEMNNYYVQSLTSYSYQGTAAYEGQVIILQNELNKREIIKNIQAR